MMGMVTSSQCCLPCQARTLRQQRAAHVYRVPALRLLLATNATDRQSALSPPAAGRSGQPHAARLDDLTPGAWTPVISLPQLAGVACLGDTGASVGGSVTTAEVAAAGVLRASLDAFLEPIETALPTSHAPRVRAVAQLQKELGEHDLLVRAAAVDPARLADLGVVLGGGDAAGAAPASAPGGNAADPEDDGGAASFEAGHEVEAEAEAEAEAMAEQEEEAARPPPAAPLHALGTTPWRLLDVIAMGLRSSSGSGPAPEGANLPSPWPWLSLSAFGGEDEAAAPEGLRREGGSAAGGTTAAIWRVPAPGNVLVSANACRGTEAVAASGAGAGVYALPPRLFSPRVILWVQHDATAGSDRGGGGHALLLSLREAETVRGALWALQRARADRGCVPCCCSDGAGGRGGLPVSLSLWLLPQKRGGGAGVAASRSRASLLLAATSLARTPPPAAADPPFPGCAAAHARFFASATDPSAAEVGWLMTTPGGPGSALPLGLRATAFAALARGRVLDHPRWERTPLAPIFSFATGEDWRSVAGPLARIAAALRLIFGSLRRAYAACVAGRVPADEAAVQAALLGAGVPLARVAALCSSLSVVTHMPQRAAAAGAGAAADDSPQVLRALVSAAARALQQRGGGGSAADTDARRRTFDSRTVTLSWPDVAALLALGGSDAPDVDAAPTPLGGTNAELAAAAEGACAAVAALPLGGGGGGGGALEQPADLVAAAAYVGSTLEDVRWLVEAGLVSGSAHSGVPPRALDALPVISLASLARLLGLAPPATVDALALGGLPRIIRWRGALAVPVRDYDDAAQRGGWRLPLDSSGPGGGRTVPAPPASCSALEAAAAVGAWPEDVVYLVESGQVERGAPEAAAAGAARGLAATCRVRLASLAALSVLPLEELALELGGGGGALPSTAALERALERAGVRRLVWWAGRLSVTGGDYAAALRAVGFHLELQDQAGGGPPGGAGARGPPPGWPKTLPPPAAATSSFAPAPASASLQQAWGAAVSAAAAVTNAATEAPLPEAAGPMRRQCPGCAAVVDLPAGARAARCPYCKAVVRALAA